MVFETQLHTVQKFVVNTLFLTFHQGKRTVKRVI